MTFTAYGDVDAILTALRDGVAAALAEELAGVYVTGSLAWGGYAPGASDIDVLVATSRPLSPEQFETLRALHGSLRESDPPLSHRMDVPYLTVVELAGGEPAGTHPMADSSVLRMVPHTLERTFDRHIGRERGIVLLGPPPREIIAAVTPDQLRAATHEELRGPWMRNLQPEQEDWLRPRHRQAFAVLTMCRALHTLHTGELLSKPDAAGWAIEHVDVRWHELIGRSLAWRFDRTPDDVEETRAFMRFVLNAARQYGG